MKTLSLSAGCGHYFFARRPSEGLSRATHFLPMIMHPRRRKYISAFMKRYFVKLGSIRTLHSNTVNLVFRNWKWGQFSESKKVQIEAKDPKEINLRSLLLASFLCILHLHPPSFFFFLQLSSSSPPPWSSSVLLVPSVFPR